MAGYPGWLSSHGLNYGGRLRDMDYMMKGAGDAYSLLKSYGVTHIVVPWKHRRDFNIEFLNAVGSRVTSNGRYTVYEVALAELGRPIVPCGSGSLDEAACRASGCLFLPHFAGHRCQVKQTSPLLLRTVLVEPTLSRLPLPHRLVWPRGRCAVAVLVGP